MNDFKYKLQQMTLKELQKLQTLVSQVPQTPRTQALAESLTEALDQFENEVNALGTLDKIL